ncbi:DMT family transporter [Cryobacterium lactosi]|uniref:DMT family transporter n=1 Tax=Cryobacterium lactosi TaxID=1259202 RepID=A0A4R9BXS7_9MICO|nr:DMT family transporter [Cryobacterium lactosi]TFD93051.1 DMT family transporter [Cryobacterium lactosi]
MTKGISFGAGAGLLWGLAFVLPALAPGWSAVAITTGRYLVYGVVSVGIVLLLNRRPAGGVDAILRHWRPALAFAVTGNVGYYLLLVVAIQAVGAPVVTVVIGSLPVVIATVSNVRDHTYRWRRLAIPLLLVGTGLAVVSVPELLASEDIAPLSVAIGLIAAIGAVALWTAYGVSNADFLERNPEVGGSLWAAIVGVFTGILAVLLIPVALVTGVWSAPTPPTGANVSMLLAVSVILGLVVSWGGTWLWNEGSSRLPTVLAGLLIAVETISGYVYAYILEARLPTVLEATGFGLVIVGVVVIARMRRAKKTSTAAAAIDGMTATATLPVPPHPQAARSMR